jgi:hypothetical protein
MPFSSSASGSATLLSAWVGVLRWTDGHRTGKGAGSIAGSAGAGAATRGFAAEIRSAPPLVVFTGCR